MCAGGKGFQIFGHKRQNKAASFGCVLILFQSGFVNESTLEQIKRVEMIGDVFNGKGQTAIAVYCPCSICLCECEIEASGLGVAIVSVADSLCLAVLRGCRLFNEHSNITVFKLVQFSKTRLPILLTLEGTVNEFRLVQSEKAANPIDVIFPLNETEFKLEQLLNVASTISEI